MKYNILGRYISESETTGYGLIDDDGNLIRAKIDDFNNMVKNSLVDGFESISLDNKEYIVPKNSSISTLKSLNDIKYTVRDRIYNDDGAVIGYIVTDIDTNEEMRLSNKKVWELSVNNMVDNVTANLIDKQGEITKTLSVSV